MFNAYNTYDVGEPIRLNADVQISGTYVDPDYLLLTVQSPDGVDHNFVYGQTGTFIKQSTGQYYLNFFITQYGQYSYRFFCSGTAWGAEEKSFIVRIQQT